MAVSVSPKSNMKWALLAVGLALAGGVAWWRLSGESPTEAGTAADTAASAAAMPAPVESPETNIADVVPGATSAEAVIAQQMAVAKEVEKQPDLKPITGPVSERPSFVTPMEWSMLQAVSQQHADSEKQLLRMLNFMRFMKQSEALEAMPKPGEPGKRRALAEALVSDLPERVLNGDMDEKGAREELVKLLQDAEPEAARRDKRMDAEVKRLLAAQEQYNKNEAAKAPELAASKP